MRAVLLMDSRFHFASQESDLRCLSSNDEELLDCFPQKVSVNLYPLFCHDSLQCQCGRRDFIVDSTTGKLQ